MEIRFKRIIEQLERKKNTHPYLAQLWQSYMEIKKEKLLHYCSCCENVIERMGNEPDIPPDSVMTILILMSHCTTDLNRIR